MKKLRITIIGPGDIKYHYQKLLKIREKTLKKHINNLGKVIANSNNSIAIVPDKGICLEIARSYKKQQGKQALAVIPKDDKKIEEWIKQSEYDFKTAQAMFSTGRYVYTVFMCHLALEKILKALYFKTLNVNPPKTHDLLFLISKIDRELPDEKINFLKILPSGFSISILDELKCTSSTSIFSTTSRIPVISQTFLNFSRLPFPSVAGLSPTIGIPPASLTNSITAASTVGWVVTAFSGGLPDKRFGLISTLFPPETNFSIPPKSPTASLTADSTFSFSYSEHNISETFEDIVFFLFN